MYTELAALYMVFFGRWNENGEHVYIIYVLITVLSCQSAGVMMCMQTQEALYMPPMLLSKTLAVNIVIPFLSLIRRTNKLLANDHLRSTSDLAKAKIL